MEEIILLLALLGVPVIVACASWLRFQAAKLPPVLVPPPEAASLAESWGWPLLLVTSPGERKEIGAKNEFAAQDGNGEPLTIVLCSYSNKCRCRLHEAEKERHDERRFRCFDH